MPCLRMSTYNREERVCDNAQIFHMCIILNFCTSIDNEEDQSMKKTSVTRFSNREDTKNSTKRILVLAWGGTYLCPVLKRVIGALDYDNADHCNSIFGCTYSVYVHIYCMFKSE